MPQLLWCDLYGTDTLTLAASLLDNLKNTAFKIKPRLRLNTLILDPEDSNLPHIQDYPPQGAFGSLVNLTRFEFGLTTAAAVSDTFLQFLGEMVSLEELGIQQWLQHLPSIPEFNIRVEDDNKSFNKDWWRIEITKNLPALKDTLTVDVDVYYEGNETDNLLWSAEPKTASSINTENSMHINSELDELSGLSEPYPGIDGSNLEDNTVTDTVGALQAKVE
ncbi:hypothetical protein VTO73DRAFT_13819 [Trametes versicolor]